MESACASDVQFGYEALCKQGTHGWNEIPRGEDEDSSARRMSLMVQECDLCLLLCIMFNLICEFSNNFLYESLIHYNKLYKGDATTTPIAPSRVR
jgi:hypothetical protein